MVAEKDYVRLLEAIANAEDGLPKAHIRLGMSMRCEDLGAVGLAWKSSPTLLEGWDRAQRYVSVVVGVRALELTRGEESTEIRFLRLTNEAPKGAKLSNEATFASFIAICREASGRPFKPVRALCAHEFIGDQANEHDLEWAAQDSVELCAVKICRRCTSPAYTPETGEYRIDFIRTVSELQQQSGCAIESFLDISDTGKPNYYGLGVQTAVRVFDPETGEPVFGEKGDPKRGLLINKGDQLFGVKPVNKADFNARLFEGLNPRL